LDATLRQEVAAFSNDLRRVGAAGTAAGGAVAGIGDSGLRAGQVSLEFYQKKRRWPFAPENIPWEVWTIRTDLVHFANEHERQHWQEKVGEMLADKVMYIAEVTNFDSQQFALKRRMLFRPITYWRSAGNCSILLDIFVINSWSNYISSCFFRSCR